MRKSRVLLFFCLVSGSSGQKVGITSALGYGCWNCAERWNFGCGKEPVLQECRCHTMAFLGTVLHCINKYAKGQEDKNWGYEYIRDFCYYNGGGVHYSARALDEIYKSASQDMTPSSEVSLYGVNYKAVGVSKDAFNKEYQAAKFAKRQYWLGTMFGIGLIGYWLAVIICAGVANFLKHQCLTCRDTVLTCKPISKFRRYFTLHALMRKKHSSPIRIMGYFTVQAPTRGQSIIIIVYAILNVLFVALGYRNYAPNNVWTCKRDELLRYIGNRTGIIAIAQIPTLMLFSARNNPLRHVTGWSYQTFQLYHHCTARMMAVQALVHSVCFTWLALIQGTVKFRWSDVRNWRFGNLAMYAVIFMLILSLHTFRARFYEFFAWSHKVLSVAFLAFMILHCIDFGWMTWIYVSIGFVALERIARLIRVFNSGYYSKGVFQLCETVSDEPSVFRITISYSQQWEPRAGSYAYIRILTPTAFWQSHPFTVYQLHADEGGETTLQAVCKAKSGLTSQIVEKLLEARNHELVWRVLLDGPYGSAMPIHTYDSLLIISGGIGFTASYSYAPRLNREPSPSRILFIWVIREEEMMSWFQDELRSLSQNRRIELRIFVTRSPDLDPVTSTRSSTKAPAVVHSTEIAQDTADLRHVIYAKPKISDEIRIFVHSANGSSAIFTCGPPKFVDEARSAVVNNIEAVSQRIDYFEEAFSW